MSTHSERVARIAGQVRAKVGKGGHTSLRKSQVSHFVPNPLDPKHKDQKIDIRGLGEILEIDIPGRRCVAEPGLAFCDLVKRTLPLGFIPKLVPELETITIGGAVAGCSVESMSFKYGGFHDTCKSYEVITGEGEILLCSREHESELFELIHGSYGTLGILTQIEFELMEAKPFVRMEYRRMRSLRAFHEEMMKCCENGEADFIDAIIHSSDNCVLCLGHFEDSVPYTSDYRKLNVFYKSTALRETDYLTTYDYLFRYDTECHWLTRTLPVPFMETKPMRMALGGLLLGSTNILSLSKKLRPLLAYHQDPHVVVDVFIPEDGLDEFLDWYERVVEYYPLWVVPYRAPSRYPWIHPEHGASSKSEYFIDCAVYGKRNDKPGVDYYKLLEDKTRELGGIKTLISKNSYTEKEFWSVYNRELYEKVKKRSDPHNMFRGLYEKFHSRA